MKSELDQFSPRKFRKIIKDITGKFKLNSDDPYEELKMIFEFCSDKMLIITGEQLDEPAEITPIFDPIYILIGIQNESVFFSFKIVIKSIDR